METTKTKYANALFSLAREKKCVLDYQNEIKEIFKIFKTNPDFITLLDCSFLPIQERINNVRKVFDNKLSKDIESFLEIIVKNNRSNCLLDILQEFISLCNDDLNVSEGIVFSAIPLDDLQMNNIQQAICKYENKKIFLINKVSPSLIGGIKVVIDDHIYDGSIENKLENLRKKLMK